MGCRPDPDITEKRGAETGPGFRDKWRRRAKMGQRRDPGTLGMGKSRERCWHWMVLVAETWMLAPTGVKAKLALVMTLGEIRRGLSGTKLDLRKKVKNATRNKAHIAVCSGSERLKWANAACKIEGVIAYFRATAWPKKRLVPLSKSWKW